MTTKSVLLGTLILVVTSSASQAQESSLKQQKPRERAHVAIAQALPDMDGGHLRVSLVEVNYGPGEASPPHSHASVVIGYVAEGAIRSQVKGGPETTYHEGETFYEPANGVHTVSANASSTAPAKLLAYFVCDREAPLSVNVPMESK